MSLTPLLIGLAGSLHCIGMCGALSTMVTNGGRHQIWKRGLYNAGRIITYGLLGSIITFFGSLMALTGIQNWVSLLIGGLMLSIGITGIRPVSPLFLKRPLAMFGRFLKARFSLLLSMKSTYGILIMGMINGLLPCGMTWIALGYCATLQWPFDGFISMILFGLGTIPAMIGFSSIVNKLTAKFHINFKTIQTALLILSGCLLIIRTIGDNYTRVDHEITICGAHAETYKK